MPDECDVKLLNVQVSPYPHGMAIEPFRLLNFAGLLHLGKGWSNGRQALRGHRIGVAPEKAKPHRAGDRRGTWPAGARRSPQPQSRCPPPPPRARPVACVGEKGFAFALAHPVSPRRRPRGDGGSSAKRSRDRPTTTVVKAKTTPIFSPLGDARPP